jgi:ABC-type lipoprotein release transport system permease subunit
LGAHSGHILRLVVREGLLLIMIGLSIGVIIAVMVAQYLQSQLFGVSALDISTYLIEMAVITLACSLASWLPARTAAASNALDVYEQSRNSLKTCPFMVFRARVTVRDPWRACCHSKRCHPGR